MIDYDNQKLSISFLHVSQTIEQDLLKDLDNLRKQWLSLMDKYNIKGIEVSNFTVKDEYMHIGTIFIDNK
jgi:hypothetical protein